LAKKLSREMRLSYDLQVFAPNALPVGAIRDLLAQTRLSCADAGSGDSDALTVLRGAKGKYSFTLGAPVSVEAEDVPEEVTGVLLGAEYLYEVLVEGSSTTEIPHAIRFARTIAEASDGVVLDQQTGEIWQRGKLRTAPKVERGKTDIVDVHWYVRGGANPESSALQWLALAKRHLPEALPRRFGTYEPLPMKMDLDRAEPFIEMVRNDSNTVYFKASNPCIEGSLASEATDWLFRSHSLSLHRAALNDARWRNAFRGLFIDFAEQSRAVFATAEVVRGLEWSGRGLAYGPSAERSTYLARGGQWSGLLPYPAWWTWFGPFYAPLVADHLGAGRTEVVGDGLFHSRGDEPLDRDQLVDQLSDAAESAGRRGMSGWLKRRPPTNRAALARTWLPDELMPVSDDTDPNVYIPPLKTARVIPPGLDGNRS
jgi:hypothetical protein